MVNPSSMRSIAKTLKPRIRMRAVGDICTRSPNRWTLQWVHWFNHIRLLTPIGGIPPAEAEANYYRQLANQAATVTA